MKFDYPKGIYKKHYFFCFCYKKQTPTIACWGCENYLD